MGSSVRAQASKSGYKYAPEVAARNKAQGRADFWRDASRVAEWKTKHRRPNLSPNTLQRLSEAARARNHLGEFRCTGHTDETRKKMSATRMRAADKRLSFAPRGHPLRKEYTWLVGEVGKEEALRIILDEVERLPAFEKQLLRVQAGSGVVRKVAAPTKNYDYALGGASS
jgi:hypothetical protein